MLIATIIIKLKIYIIKLLDPLNNVNMAFNILNLNFKEFKSLNCKDN